MRRIATFLFCISANITGCGIDQPPSQLTTTAVAQSHVLQPFNVTTQCMGYSFAVVRDHRYNPPKVYNQYFPKFVPCDQINQQRRLTITAIAGGAWSGRDGGVVIRNDTLGLCLTNPAVYGIGGVDMKQLRYERCRNQQTETANAAAQVFYIRTNQHGAAQIQSHLQFARGVPNPQIECIERKTPIDLHRTACSGLGNFMFRRM